MLCKPPPRPRVADLGHPRDERQVLGSRDLFSGTARARNQKRRSISSRRSATDVGQADESDRASGRYQRGCGNLTELGECDAEGRPGSEKLCRSYRLPRTKSLVTRAASAPRAHLEIGGGQRSPWDSVLEAGEGSCHRCRAPSDRRTRLRSPRPNTEGNVLLPQSSPAACQRRRH